jgi:hypothetical protein
MDDTNHIISFSDEQIDIVLLAVSVLPVQWRHGFIMELAAKLTTQPDVAFFSGPLDETTTPCKNRNGFRAVSPVRV